MPLRQSASASETVCSGPLAPDSSISALARRVSAEMRRVGRPGRFETPYRPDRPWFQPISSGSRGSQGRIRGCRSSSAAPERGGRRLFRSDREHRRNYPASGTACEESGLLEQEAPQRKGARWGAALIPGHRSPGAEVCRAE